MSDMADESYTAEKLEIQEGVDEALEPLAGCEGGPVWEGETPYCRRCGVVIPRNGSEPCPVLGFVSAAQSSRNGTSPRSPSPAAFRTPRP